MSQPGWQRRVVGAFWHIFKVVRGALIFTWFYLSGALYGWVYLPLLSRLESDPVERMKRNQRAVARGFRRTLYWLRWARIFDFDPCEVAPNLPGHPIIIVSNHPTTIDVVSVLSVYPEASVVVKHKIWNDKLLQRLFRYCGHIPGGDGSMDANITLLTQVKERLAQGLNVVIFPEGTRSPTHGLGPMFKGAFAVASTTQTDILPVVIRCEPPALHKEAPWHDLPEHVVSYRVEPQQLIRTKGMTAKRLQREVTDLYRRELGLTVAEEAAHVEVAARSA
jgi:1-acyl-sn-glycerol-3-phosphate acyltransferase